MSLSLNLIKMKKTFLRIYLEFNLNQLFKLL